MFKKVLSLTLVLTMVVSMFCGCSTAQTTQTSQNETVSENNTEYADTVVYGTIYTAENQEVVEAFAIKDGKYIYVGDKAGASKYIKEGET